MDVSLFEDVSCVCGSDTPPVRVIEARDQASGEIFTYHACSACSLERLVRRPTLEHIGTYYPPHYAPYVALPKPGWADHLKRIVYEVFWAPAAEARANIRRWRGLLRVFLAPVRYRTVLSFHPPAHRRVFEFGAARATDLIAFKAAGWSVEGCEPSAQACTVAAENGIVLQNTTAENAALAPASYTCILFNNVFEHIHDPVGVLAKCYTALEMNGVLVVIVPNHHSLTSRVFGGAWPGYDAPRHLWGWTPQAIRTHFACAGFAIEGIHHQATGAWLWQSTLDMRHANRSPSALRLWLARKFAMLGIPVSIGAALFHHGDFIRVIARKSTLPETRASVDLASARPEHLPSVA